jgi:hypothetical protein
LRSPPGSRYLSSITASILDRFVSIITRFASYYGIIASIIGCIISCITACVIASISSPAAISQHLGHLGFDEAACRVEIQQEGGE